MAAASEILPQTEHKGEHHYIRIRFTDNGALDLSPQFEVPRRGQILRVKWTSDGGTVNPRFLDPVEAIDTEPAGGPGEAGGQVLTTALQNADIRMDVPYRCGGKLQAQLQGTGLGRAVTLEIYILERWT